MTDITELAQSLKAAAEKAIAEEGSTWWSEEQLASDYGLALHRTDAKFIALASHENVLALVEALEKAQQRISEISDQKSTWVAWAEDASGMVDMLRLRIAELESRTVKLPELCVGVVQDGHAVMVPYPAGHWFNKTAILEMLAAAGIKVEAE